MVKGEYCLGNSCRFYNEKPDAICFKQGVLPKCSPELRQTRKKLDTSSPDMYEALEDLVHGFLAASEMAGLSEDLRTKELAAAVKALAKVEGRDNETCKRI